MTKLENTLNQVKALVLSGVIVLSTQWLSLIRGGSSLGLGKACAGMLAIIAICVLALKIKELIPWKIPAFAWASLLALLLTTPWSPVQGVLLDITAQISAGTVGTVILAVAGISIGTKLDDIKKLSWKMILIAVVVFCGTFFGSALIAQTILSFQGII